MAENLNKSQIDAEVDAFSLIDVSNSDDDFLFASSSDVSAVDNPGFGERVPMNQPSDSLGLHKPKKSTKINLRKSLAWDSAFFTNAGVLDPEELSSIIEGAETGVKQSYFLPGIQEDLSKSTDSNSTFQSDLTLESLEADLFCDIKASIQRCSKSSTPVNSCDSKNHGEESMGESSTKLAEPSAPKLAKPKSASNRQNSGVRTLKPGPVSKQEKPIVNRSRVPSSSLSRLPKPASHPNFQVAATTSRMSVGVGRARQDTNVVASVKGKGSSLPEAANQVNSRKILPKAPVPAKITASSVLLNKTTSRSSRSSCDSSSSSTSENVRKSQTGAIRKKIEKAGNLPSVSKTRTSSNVVGKAKAQNKESHLSEFVKSSSNLSPSVSPSSSISEWSTESSSSMPTLNQKHYSLSSFPSSQSVTVGSIVSRNLHNVSSDRALNGPQVAGVNHQSLKQASTESVSNARPGLVKPSGLRMPSPNIGFFDGIKAGARTPSSSSRSRTVLPSSLPRSLAGTCSPSRTGSINKSKLGTSNFKVTAAGTAKPKQKIIDANSKTAARSVDHGIILENSPCSKQTDNASETFSEFCRSTPPKSALERNTPEASLSESGTRVPDSLLVSEDNLGSDLVAVDTPKLSLERINRISTSSDTESRVLYSEQVGKDNLACELVITTTEDAPKPDISCASLKPAEGKPSMSVLEQYNEVNEVPDGGQRAPELPSIVKDNLVTSEKKTRAEENSIIATDVGNYTTINQLEDDPQSTDPNLTFTVKTADNDTGSTHELSKSTAQNSASEAEEIADARTDSIPNFGSVVKDSLPFHGKDEQEVLHSNYDMATFIPEDGSDMLNPPNSAEVSAIPISNLKERDLNIGDNIHDFTSQKVDDADNLKSVGQHTVQDEGTNVGCYANNENQCVENGLVEIKDNSNTANYEGEIHEGSHISVQSLAEKFSSLILNSPLPTGADPASRTPFAIKNSESNVVEMITRQLNSVL